MTHPQVSIVNSTRIETYSGAGEKTPFFLLPGMFGGSWLWHEVAGGLAGRGYEVSVMSDPLGLNPTIGDIPKLITSTAELLELMYDEPVVLAGNSMGALISIEIAARRPELLKAVVISGAPGLGEKIPVPEELIRTRGLTGKDFAVEQTMRLFHNKDLLTPELFDRVHGTFDGASSKQKLAILRCVRTIRGYDARDLFPQITVPALLIWGDEDEVSPNDEWERAASLFPDARYVGIPDAGHSPMLEQPDLFLSALTEFVDGSMHGSAHHIQLAPAGTYSAGNGFATVCDLIRRKSTTTTDLTPDTLLSDVGLDSLGALDLMLTCEDELGVPLLGEDTPEIQSLGEAGAFVDERLKRCRAS
jgi:pimeloyl-ACP methyl ester carboxylesterase/acyl carrier protein